MGELTALQQARLEVETALSLLTPDRAEEMVEIGAEGFGELIAGSKSVIALMWAMLKQQGAPETPATLKVVAQAIMMEAQIVNYAYAMGLRAEAEGWGQRARRDGPWPDGMGKQPREDSPDGG